MIIGGSLNQKIYRLEVVMSDLNKNGIYQIKVTNKVDKSIWIHKRVPCEHIECLRLSPNLDVEVVRMVGTEVRSGKPFGYKPKRSI